ncbi:MAG: class I SAM-dependent methyltransferase [Tenericutes bacterium]|nr:class I SAM-dependent methyltransferase [Mycoplasmatota bacterium]
MKANRNHPYLFQLIAPFYGWFFKAQKRRYLNNIKILQQVDVFSNTKSVVDIGCGTGALASALHENGFNVTGIDPVIRMLKISRRKTNNNISFEYGNVLNGLDIVDKKFDMSVASYVAHGLKKAERMIMYKEMKRITKDKVLLFEYNNKRHLISDVIECIEGGDYFNFIKDARSELEEIFKSVHSIELHKQGLVYICEV